MFHEAILPVCFDWPQPSTIAREVNAFFHAAVASWHDLVAGIRLALREPMRLAWLG
jgi:hypothetical protein